jgi:GDP-4-dehydro-6-deoxy-D-mannose reductase
MQVLITGAHGFVGPYVATALRHRFGSELKLFLTSKSAAAGPGPDQIDALDITDGAAVDELIGRLRPDAIVHLAGIAAVTAANADASLAWDVHLHGTLKIADAIMRHCPDCVLAFAGSGQVYGATARSGLPLDEGALLAPGNTYEVTKAATDLALGARATSGLRCIRFRPFNHTGPGQTADFVIPSFALQIARIEKGLQPPVIRVGNLDAERDFLDVRDVAAAYTLAVAKSADLPPGVILNIASGVPRRIGGILRELIALSTVSISVEMDPARLRPSDTPRFVGDATRARTQLGWSPEHPFGDTLLDVLSHCRSAVESGI